MTGSSSGGWERRSSWRSGVTLITFIMLHLLPGSLARDILGPRASPQAIAQFNHEQRPGPSVWYQYWLFLGQLLHGNLGYSYQFNRTVDSLLATELPRDIVLGGAALILSRADRDPDRASPRRCAATGCSTTPAPGSASCSTRCRSTRSRSC